MKKKKKGKVSEKVESSEQETSQKTLDLKKLSLILMIIISAILVLSSIPGSDSVPPINEKVITIIIFLIITFGLGYSGTIFLKKSSELLENMLMNFGIGLGIFPIFIVVLNTLNIALSWHIILILSLIIPLVHIIFYRKPTYVGIKEKISKSDDFLQIIIVLFISTVLFSVYIKGAFSYPYLEDDDSWDHAVGAKYVSIFKTYSLPKDLYVTHYLEPYPPGYDVLMGVLHQLNTSVYWTLKFSTSILAASSIVFCYFFVKRFTKNKNIALAASFILAVIPPYLSHAIWAHAYGITIMFPALYALERISEDRKWAILSTILISSIMVVQPMVSPVFGIFFILYYTIRAIIEKNLLKYVIISGVLGLLISMLYWVPEVMKYGIALGKIYATQQIVSFNIKFGHENKVYPLEEIVFAPPFGNIFIHHGFGIIVTLLFLISFFWIIANFKTAKREYWIPVTLSWFIFTFIGMESWALPVSIYADRFWGFLPIPVAIIAAQGIIIVKNICEKQRISWFYIMILIIAGILYTSAYPRYMVQSSPGWPPGSSWSSGEQLQGYIGLKNLPPDTKVFPACMQDAFVIGFDKLSFPWDKEVIDFRNSTFNKSAYEVFSWLKSKNYEYIIFDTSCITDCTNKQEGNVDFCADRLNKFLNATKNSNLFSLAYSTKGFILFRV